MPHALVDVIVGHVWGKQTRVLETYNFINEFMPRYTFLRIPKEKIPRLYNQTCCALE
jgi:hypothetical protein